MNTILTLGPLTLTRYGLCTAAAMLAFFAVFILAGCKKGVSYPKMAGACALTVIPALVCSRLLYVIAQSPWYIRSLERPDLMLCFWDGGASLMGAVIGIVLTVLLTEKIYGLRKGTLTDALVPALPVGICLMRLNEIGTQLGFGYECPEWWPSFLTVTDEMGIRCHAVNLYEAAAVLIVMLIMLIWMRSAGRHMPAGDPVRLFLVLYCGAQLIFEAMRNDQHMVLHFVHISQVTALLVIAVCLLHWTRLYCRSTKGRSRVTVTWIVLLVFVGIAVAASFMIDRSEYKWIAWSLLVLGVFGIVADTLAFRVRANYVAGE